MIAAAAARVYLRESGTTVIAATTLLPAEGPGAGRGQPHQHAAGDVFRPVAPYDLGGEFDDTAKDYSAGIVYELAEEANRMRAALEAQRRGERLEDCAARFAIRGGELSAGDVRAVVACSLTPAASDDEAPARSAVTAADALATRLLHIGAPIVHNPAEQARVLDLFEAATVQAGLVRHAAQRVRRRQTQQLERAGDAQMVTDVANRRVSSISTSPASKHSRNPTCRSGTAASDGPSTIARPSGEVRRTTRISLHEGEIVDLYNFTATEISRWGTRPHITGHGLAALDLMDVVSSQHGIDDLAITDGAGKPVTIGQVIAAARTEVTTGEAHQHWASEAAWAILDKLGAVNAAASREITDSDWLRAGRWWADEVGTPLAPEVVSAVRERLFPRDRAQLDHGVRQFVAAATTPDVPRFRGDLGASVPTSAPPRPSRVRGTATGLGASLPGTRPTTGGAPAGHAGAQNTAPGTARR